MAFKILTLLAIALSFSVSVLAEENYEDYDSIVSKLSVADYGDSNSLNIDDLRLHAGISYGTSISKLRSLSGMPDSISFQGFRLSLGIDLFSTDFISEVGYTNYLPESKENNSYKLSEFDLRTYYIAQMSRLIAIRGGVGVGARYLNSDTNPVGMLMLGGELKLSPRISFITEASYKDSFAADTLEKSAYDLTFRLDGHF